MYIHGFNAHTSLMINTNHLSQMFPDISQYINGILSAKNELFQLCAEVELTGESPPTLQDLYLLILEEIEDLAPTDAVEGTSDRRRALRAHHLSHNQYTRPAYRRLESNEVTRNLLDAISASVDYDGKQVLAHVELDVSKSFNTSLEELIEKPLDLLRGVDFLSELFPDASPIDLSLGLDADLLVTASAHVGVSVGFEITGDLMKEVLFNRTFNLDSSFIANRAYLTFEDISAKFELSASVSGDIDLGGSVEVGVSLCNEQLFVFS